MKILQKICFVLLLGTFSSVYSDTSLPQEALDRIEITEGSNNAYWKEYAMGMAGYDVYNGSDWAINFMVDAQLVATGRMSRPGVFMLHLGTKLNQGKSDHHCLPYTECSGLLFSKLINAPGFQAYFYFKGFQVRR